MADYRDHEGEAALAAAKEAEAARLGLNDRERRLCAAMGWKYENYTALRQALMSVAISTDPSLSAPEPATPVEGPPNPTGLSITSDGTPYGTRVTYNGKPIDRVRSVTWRVYHDEMAQVEIEVSGVPVTVNATAPPEVNIVCAVCGEGVEHVCGADD